MDTVVRFTSEPARSEHGCRVSTELDGHGLQGGQCVRGERAQAVGMTLPQGPRWPFRLRARGGPEVQHSTPLLDSPEPQQ